MMYNGPSLDASIYLLHFAQHKMICVLTIYGVSCSKNDFYQTWSMPLHRVVVKRCKKIVLLEF